MGQIEKDRSRNGTLKKLLGRLCRRGPDGHSPLQRHVFPAAVATGIVAGVCAVKVIGLSPVAGVAVGIVAGGYAFTKAWELFIVGANAQPEGR